MSTVSDKELLAGLTKVARLIEAGHDDLLPLFEYLEKHFEKRADVMARVKRLAAAQREPAENQV